VGWTIRAAGTLHIWADAKGTAFGQLSDPQSGVDGWGDQVPTRAGLPLTPAAVVEPLAAPPGLTLPPADIHAESSPLVHIEHLAAPPGLTPPPLDMSAGAPPEPSAAPTVHIAAPPGLTLPPADIHAESSPVVHIEHLAAPPGLTPPPVYIDAGAPLEPSAAPTVHVAPVPGITPPLDHINAAAFPELATAFSERIAGRGSTAVSPALDIATADPVGASASPIELERCVAPWKAMPCHVGPICLPRSAWTVNSILSCHGPCVFSWLCITFVPFCPAPSLNPLSFCLPACL
jgi:hypothetical protein